MIFLHVQVTFLSRLHQMHTVHICGLLLHMLHILFSDRGDGPQITAIAVLLILSIFYILQTSKSCFFVQFVDNTVFLVHLLLIVTGKECHMPRDLRNIGRVVLCPLIS